MSTTGKKSGKQPQRLPHIEPVAGEPGRYYVQSSTRLNMRHLVDMWAYDGNGACGCEDFERRFRPHLEGGAVPSIHLECKHLRAVRHYSAVELWQTIASHRKQADKERVAQQKRQETERRYADHEEMAEVEGKTEGTLDYPSGGRVYQLKSWDRNPPRNATRQDQNKVKGNEQPHAHLPSDGGTVQGAEPDVRLRMRKEDGRHPSHPGTGGNSASRLAVLATRVP